MAMARGYSDGMADAAKAGSSRVTKPRSASSKARAARVAAAADSISMDAAVLDETLTDTVPLGSPERKYSFNTLIAAGVIGFVVGRIFAR